MHEPIELTTGELLLVTSLRLYALPFREPHLVHPDWRGGFNAAGVGEVAVPAFAALFDVVSRVPLYPLEIGGPRCHRLHRDEAKFLHLIALKQRSRYPEANTILRQWVPAAAARLAAMPALGLAFALERRGLRLPLREIPLPFPSPLPDRGLGLVQ